MKFEIGTRVQVTCPSKEAARGVGWVPDWEFGKPYLATVKRYDAGDIVEVEWNKQYHTAYGSWFCDPEWLELADGPW